MDRARASPPPWESLRGARHVSETIRSVLLGTAGLSAMFVAAVIVTVARGPIRATPAALTDAARWAVLATGVQLVHFAEELGTGFPQRFPEVLGLTPWPVQFFLSFNLFWMVVWAISSWGLLAKRLPAVAALWFLGIAGVANGVAHPALSLRVGGYFPGLVSSWLVGGVALILLRRLTSITRQAEAGSRDSLE